MGAARIKITFILFLLLLSFQNCGSLEGLDSSESLDSSSFDSSVTFSPSSCDKDQNCFDVTKFGAANDGETDALEGIQKAADAVVDGGTLYFPAGKYLINKSGKLGPMRGGVQITKKRNVKVTGEGSDKSVIIDAFNSLLYPGIDVWVGSFALRGGRNIHISNLGFVSKTGFSSDSPSYGGVSIGLLVEGVIGLRIENISAENYNHSGVLISSRHMPISERCIKEQTGPSQDIKITSSFLAYNRIAGLMLDRAEKILVEKNNFYRNGSPGDGHTGYGSAASSCGAPKDVVVRDNIAEDNVRKGIDFHSGFDLKVYDNKVIGNGLYGIFFGGMQKLGGLIEVYNNSISKMNPTRAQSVHQLDSVKYPKDLRNDPTGENTNGIYNTVFAIYFYMKGDPLDENDPTKIKPAKVKIYNNKIFDFTGENPPNGVAQRYFPFVLRSQYRSYASFEIYNNEFDVGEIYSFVSSNRVTEKHGRRTLIMKNNLLKYGHLGNSLIYLSQMRKVDILNNIFKKKNSLSDDNAWTDKAITIDAYSKEPYLTSPVIYSSGNTWIK